MKRVRLGERRGACLFVGLGACIALWMVLPQGVTLLNDDFGYLRSVLQTAAKGRPWTDDWLEPWAASLSTISALIFKVSGSFRLATQGLQCVCWGAFVAAVCRALERRDMSLWGAVFLSLAICYTPTIFWKSMEFTGLVLYLPCLALAIGAALKNQWALFASASCLALASRQSALVWFVIPAIAWAETMTQKQPGRWRRGIAPLLVCAAGVATLAACRFGMNETHAQRLITGRTWEVVRLPIIIRAGAFALFLGLICIGAANAFRWLLGAPSNRPSGGGIRRMALRAVPVLAIGLLLHLRVFGDLQQEHDLYRVPIASLLFSVWILTAGFGWLIAPMAFNGRMLAAAVGAAMLIGLRPATWDYYWIDVAFFAFFSVFRSEGGMIAAGADATAKNHAKVRSVAAVAVIVALLVPVWPSVDRTKRGLQDCYAKEVLLEQSLRAGQITPGDIAVSPFGYSAWHLFPYFITTEAGSKEYLANFRHHLAPESLRWETRNADNHTPIADPDSVVRTGVFPSGWAGEGSRYILRRVRKAEPAPRPIIFTEYRFEPFPLDDDEWRKWKPR